MLYNVKRVIPKPKKSYWRIGIRSHAKGTFHEYIENPEMINMDELYVVKENDLILNITFAWEHAVALADKNDDGLLVSHRFPTYVFCEGQNPFFYKNVIVQERFKEMLVQISPGGAGRNRVMSKKDFLKLPCNIPSCEEQQKVAEILMQCDKLIELYQNETDELQKLKKICFCKMFPKSGNDVPEWRFPQFNDSWERRKLGDVVQITMGQSPDGSTYSDEPSDYILVQGNADLQNGWVCPRIWTTQITKKADAGDLIMSVRAPAGTMGKTAYNAVIGRGVAAIKGNEFIYQLLVKMDADGFWKTLSCGSTFESLNSDNIKNAEVKIPTTAEQIKIGGYFQQLDNLITLHQHKLEEMKKYKKSLMQLLLTGIVRV